MVREDFADPATPSRRTADGTPAPGSFEVELEQLSGGPAMTGNPKRVDDLLELQKIWERLGLRVQRMELGAPRPAPSLGAYVLSDVILQPLAVAVYALTFILAMLLQRALWTYATRPEQRQLLKEPVPDEIRQLFTRSLDGRLLVFGAVVPLAMFAPRFAALTWLLMLLVQFVATRLTR
jgi:hypothetical protein